jgi:hypothetical protein
MLFPPPIQDWMTMPAGFAPVAAAGLRPKLRQLAGFKRWIYLLLSAESHQLGVAWVDLGYLSKVFAHFSPLNGEGRAFSVEALSLARRQPWRPTPTGWLLRAGGPNLRLDLRLERGPDSQAPGRGLLHLSSARLQLAAQWEARPETLLWAETAMPHHTHKAFALPVRWQLKCDGRQITTEGLLGPDVSYGWPPRRTRWFWAFAQSREIGFNLVEGFTGAAECALWQQGKLQALDEGHFVLPEDVWKGPKHDPRHPSKAWEISTADQSQDQIQIGNPILHLRFAPVSQYQDRTRLGVISADFIQAYGRFQGDLILPGGARMPLDLPGVAEFQDTQW